MKKYLPSVEAAVLAAFSIREMPKLQFDALAKGFLNGVKYMSMPLTCASTLQSLIRSQFSMTHRLLIPLALMLALFIAMPVSSANHQHGLDAYNKDDYMPVPSANYQLGMDAYNKEDYATAFEQWRPLAEQRDIDAQYSLGYLYYYGKGVPQDYKTAVKWFILAAEQGKHGAQSILGVMYDEGKGVPQDHKVAVKWNALAAEQGKAEADAQYSLGVMYYTGEGVPQDYVRAYMWFNIAASSVFSSDYRDKLAEKLTPKQVKKAQEFARDWVEKHGN